MSKHDSQAQPLMQHILALRKALVISLGAVAACFVLSFYLLSEWLMAFITAPITERGIAIIYTAVSEALTTQLKVTLVAGIILASPVIVWQVWMFVKPALYEHECKGIRVWFFVALVLFLIGIVFCYASVYWMAIDFFLVTGEEMATPMLSIDKYVSFLLSFLLPFGVAFELPVVTYLLTKMGVTTVQTLKKIRKYVILVIFIFAAILTPPDVLSQVMLAVPMLLLYEVGILVAKMVKSGQSRQANTQSD